MNRYRAWILALALVPAAILAVGEYWSTRETDALIAETWNRQVDGILYSLNQQAYDWAANRAGDLESRLRRGEPAAGLPARGSIRAVLDARTLRGLGLTEAEAEALGRDLGQGYRRFISRPGGMADLLALGFAVDTGEPTPRVVGFLIDKNRFIAEEMEAALRLVGSQGLGVGIFAVVDGAPVFRSRPFEVATTDIRRPFWLMPDYELAIDTEGDRLQAWARARLWRSLGLIALVGLVLGGGLWLVFKTVRRESELARLKSDFVANVSHELKTPLALIRLYAETLELGRVPTEAKRLEYYKTIGQETERLTHMIRNILDFSRMEAGKTTYRFAPTDLTALLARLADMYAPVFERAGARLTTELPDTEVVVEADADALTEALLNLLDNALKYGKPGNRARLSLLKDPIRIQVRDEGAGIAPEAIPHLFDPFFRAESSLVQETKGAGLGLALVKHIADAHGWPIGVSSSPGAGSTFELVVQSGVTNR